MNFLWFIIIIFAVQYLIKQNEVDKLKGNEKVQAQKELNASIWGLLFWFVIGAALMFLFVAFFY